MKIISTSLNNLIYFSSRDISSLTLLIFSLKKIYRLVTWQSRKMLQTKFGFDKNIKSS